MAPRVLVFAPSDSPIQDWVRDAERVGLAEGVPLLVCAPDEVDARRAQHPEAPLVACLPMSPGEDLAAAGAYERVGLRADAYATTETGLREALAFIAREDRSERSRGSLRLTWLGALGQREPPEVGPVGRVYPLDEPVLIGRGPGCAIVLRTGAHSDQNTVARRHARIDREGAGVRVQDLQSTNGTWVDGARVSSSIIAPGAELAFACTFRFRLDGAAGGVS